MPKRSKDRADDLAGGLGDEDYDWIRYLGEGRAPASSSASSGAGASSSASGGSGRGARPAGPAAAPRRQPRREDKEAPGPGSSGPEVDSPSRRRSRDDGGRRRRDRDRGSDRRPGSSGRPAVPDDDTGPGGYGAGGQAGRGLDSLDYYGPKAPAAFGPGGRGGGGFGQPQAGPADPGARTASGDSRTTPGRAVRLTAGRAVDLQASPADGLFNPAAEEYGQPLYAVPDRPDGGPGRPGPGRPGPGWSGRDAPRAGTAARTAAPRPDETDPRWPDEGDSRWPGPVPAAGDRNQAQTGRRGSPRPAGPGSRLDTGEFGRSLHSVHDAGSRSPAGPQRAWPDDPFADTDAGRPAGASPQQPAAGARALPARRQDTVGWPEVTAWPEATGWPETEEVQGSAPWPEATGWPETEEVQGSAPWPEATGWPETEEVQGSAPWPEATGWPETEEVQGSAPWPEATGWPETEEEHGSVPWPDAAGWPEVTDDAAFPLDEDLALGSGRTGRTGPQPRIGDRDPLEPGSGTDADGATRRFDLAAGATTAAGAGTDAAGTAGTAAAPATRRERNKHRTKQKQSGRREAAAGGMVAGEYVPGGNVPGGNVAGEYVAGGNVAGGNVAGGKATGRKAAGRKAARGRKKAGARPEAAIVSAPQPTVTGPLARPGDAGASSTGPLGQAVPAGAPARPAPATTGKQPKQPKQAKPGKGRRRGRRRVLLAGAAVVAAVAAVAAYVVLRPQTSHVVGTPPTLASFTRQRANAMAQQFKHRLLAAAGGDVKNVVAAVYQRSTGPGTKSGPQIVVFIGGNLAGNASASSLIGAYMTQMRHSFSTSPGTLGGEAACAPGFSGSPAECAWADGDTFGVVVSATTGPVALGNEMREMRPLVEHVSK